MVEAEARSILALRYMLDFRCIGSDCEDSCCESGWSIYIDPDHLLKLRRTLPKEATGDPAALPPLDRAVRMLPKSERSDRAAALLILDEQGRCPFFSAERLCRLQEANGEAALPDTCATYPRHINQVGQRTELAGALSCPEVARRALLPSDATDLVPAPSSLVGRGQLQFTAPKGPSDVSSLHRSHATARPARSQPAEHPQAPYRHLDVVRGTMARLLSLTDYSLQSRLFFTCFLSHKCAGLQPKPEAPIDPTALLQQAEPLHDPDVLAELARRLDESLRTASLPLPLLLTVLRRQRQVPGGEAFSRLVVEMAQSYRDEVPSADSLDPRGLPQPGQGDLLEPAYRTRQERVDAVFRARIDHYLFNYARHFWMKDWYTQSPSLFVHAQGFLLRVALLRFVLLGHPQAQVAAQQGATAGQALLDALAVRTFYSLSRTIEHSAGFRSALHEYIQQSASTITDSIALLSV